MDLCIIGTGYVGLVTGICFAEMGHHVICLDIQKEKIETLQKGICTIYEPGLEEMLVRNIKAKRLQFTTSYEQAITHSKVCFFALPTPSLPDGACDLTSLYAACKEIAQHLTTDYLIINKSTVPPGTAFTLKEHMKKCLSENHKNFDVDIASNPEFLKEGNAIYDCMKPDRIVIGSSNPKTIKILQDIYAPFTLNRDRILVMDILSSEMTKYAANAMLATRISFMNEIAEICKRIGANVNEVRKGIGSDSRIGYSFLYAGVGYGGSCLPKDLMALSHTSKKAGYEPILLHAVQSINQKQKKILAENISQYFSPKGGVKGKTIAVWGLAFKPDTDDMREAPSLTFIKTLLKEGAHLRLYDPVAAENARKILGKEKNITWCNNESEAAFGADGIALVTEWKQFRNLDFHPIKKTMKGTAFFDGRNQYHPKEMKEKGFDYIGIGVPDQIQT